MSLLSSEFEKINYIIYRPFDFSCSRKQLSNIYGPIVGQKAIFLFEWFIDEFDVQESLKGIISPIKRIFHSLNINSNEFCLIRERLEAIDLITTYLEEKANKKIFHIEIKQPLNWNHFISNEKLRHLLIEKIGLSEYERISLVFAGRRMPENVLNISATFNTIFNNEKINEIMSFNYDELYSYLKNNLDKTIVIDNNSKLIIETYFKTHNLSLDEIKFCVSNSIIKDSENKNFKVDSNKLSEQFKFFINSTPNVKSFDYVKIHRNVNLFNGSLSNDDVKLIVSDYMNINPYQYLSSIQKSPLSQKQTKIIDDLKNISHISDEIINLITDFTLHKTKGKYNEKYLKKIVDTINCLSLNTLEEVLIHLSNAYIAKTKTIEIFDDSYSNTQNVQNSNFIKMKLSNNSMSSLHENDQEINLDEMFKI
ncbi:hypothetical protein [Mycoplasmoides alvi]|uniref:hypothetical protein n=1 Tax=Mycoplasmoides alvi TaxID=78580 RepID=UPI00051B80B1|nr:hypothetical protein [Mycoplasmoides alvi]